MTSPTVAPIRYNLETALEHPVGHSLPKMADDVGRSPKV